MFRPRLWPGRSNYICSKCIRRFIQFKQRRLLSSTQTHHAQPLPILHSTSSKHDDNLLRQLFDNPKIFKEYATPSSPLEQSSGLFQNKLLVSAVGFRIFAQQSVEKAQKIVKRISEAASRQQLLRVVKDLDRLSDVICQVIDLSAFVRDSHPDREVVMAADEAYSFMYEYMNVLNVTQELYQSLKRAMEDSEVMAMYTEEEKMVAKILMTDFIKSGVSLPIASREKFVSLSNEISKLGSQFVNEVAPEIPHLTFANSQLGGMDPIVIKSLSQRGLTTLTSLDLGMQHAVQTADDGNIRREAYKANNTSSKRQIEVLETMLMRRAELANHLGGQNYADLTLKDKMARSPEAVDHFLTSLASFKRPFVQAEIDCLTALKREQLKNKIVALNAWDYSYYSVKLSEYRSSKMYRADSLESYFSLGTVIQGLSRFFSQIYGVQLVPQRTSPGETWNDDVRRLDVISEDEGHIAVIYCDLFKRDGKNPNPCHYTLRCSRLIDDIEMEETTEPIAHARRRDGALYQLPIIALICDFPPTSTSRPPLLEFHEVTTLFHEMGHALHSILARTTLHNVAGTRCATDFSELPSIMMEYFAKSPQVAALYARHWETDAPLPTALFNEKLAIDASSKHSEFYTQIVLALLDQRLHSNLAFDASFDSTKIYYDLETQYNILPPVRGTSWHGFFTHLFGYGALYYSYLLDMAIADRIWKENFVKDPLSREMGEKYKNEVLKWGGARDPWMCLGKYWEGRSYRTVELRLWRRLVDGVL